MPLLLVLLMFACSAFAVDYTQDANCVGAWFMNGPSAGWELDRSGNGHRLTAVCTNVNLLRITSSAPLDTGAFRHFNYAAAAANMSYLWKNVDGSTLDIGGTSAKISIVAWINTDSISTFGSTGSIVSKYAATGNKRQYMLATQSTVAGSTMKFKAILSHDGTNQTVLYSPDTTYADDTWYHLAVTSDDVNMILYVNGDSVTSVEYTSGIKDTNATFQICGFGTNYSYRGYVDDVAVFNDALTPAEVADIYANGLAGDDGASDYPLYKLYSNTDGTIPLNADHPAVAFDTVAAICARNTAWTDTVWGESAQGEDIFGGLYLPDGYTHKIMVSSAIHGYEDMPALATTELMKWVADSGVWPDKIALATIIMINPDGVADSTRKNANTTAIDEPTPRYVDLNRNFPVDWANGGSTDPSASTYKGPSPASEPETQTVINAVQWFDPDVLVDFHMSSNDTWVEAASDTLEPRYPNTYMTITGHQPFVKTSVTPEGGSLYEWGDSAVGIPASYACEGFGSTGSTNADLPANIEQINRFISHVVGYAEYLQDAPMFDTVTVDACSLVTVTWFEYAFADSFYILRDGVEIGRVVADTLQWLDTVDVVNNYIYGLISKSSTDTSDTAFYSITILPDSVIGLAATSDADSIFLSWTAVAGVTAYYVYVDSVQEKSVNPAAHTTFWVPGDMDLHSYYISGVNDCGEGAGSVEISIATSADDQLARGAFRNKNRNTLRNPYR